MIEFLSQLHLLIAVSPLLAYGLLVGLVGLYFARRERLESLAQAQAADVKAQNPPPEKPKAANA